MFYEAAAGAVSILGGSSGTMIIMIVVMIAIFYFLMIRPENKKKKALEKMRSDTKVGDNITTIGGVVGDVCHISGDNIVIETGEDKVRVEFSKWAISTNNTAQKEAEKAAAASKAKRKSLFGKKEEDKK